jgi:hypothetical protein
MIGPGKALDTKILYPLRQRSGGLRGHHRSRQLQSRYRKSLRPGFSFSEYPGHGKPSKSPGGPSRHQYLSFWPSSVDPWAECRPSSGPSPIREMVRSGIILASTHRLSPQGIAFHAVGRNAIFQDPHWKEGNYTLQGDQPTQGLAIARMIGHITYLSDESMRSKFGRRVKEGVINPFTGSEQFEVEGYLLHQGNKFVKRFDANSYIYLTRAMDTFDLGKPYGGLEGAFARSNPITSCSPSAPIGYSPPINLRKWSTP